MDQKGFSAAGSLFSDSLLGETILFSSLIGLALIICGNLWQQQKRWKTHAGR